MIDAYFSAAVTPVSRMVRCSPPAAIFADRKEARAEEGRAADAARCRQYKPAPTITSTTTPAIHHFLRGGAGCTGRGARCGDGPGDGAGTAGVICGCISNETSQTVALATLFAKATILVN
jgi:hypothetical protein